MLHSEWVGKGRARCKIVGADRVELRLSQQKPQVAVEQTQHAARDATYASVCVCECVAPKSNCASCRPFLRVGGNSLVLMPAEAEAAAAAARVAVARGNIERVSRMRHTAVG